MVLNVELVPPNTGQAFEAMRELRPELVSREDFVQRVDQLQRPSGYRLVVSVPDVRATTVAVAGFRLGDATEVVRVLLHAVVPGVGALESPSEAPTLLSLAGSRCEHLAAGDGKVSQIDPRDIAAAAAVTLTQPGHEQQTYALTGPVAIGYADAAATLTRLLGRQVSYVPVDDATAHATMTGLGLPPAQADDIVALGRVYAAGYAAQVTDDVERLTGNTPRGFETFAADHLAAFE